MRDQHEADLKTLAPSTLPSPPAASTDEQASAFWRSYLAGFPSLLALPTDAPRQVNIPFASATYDFTLPADLANNLVLLAQRAGVALDLVLFAAYHVWLLRYTGQTDLVVGRAIAGQSGEYVAIRTNLAGQPTFAQVLDRLRASIQLTAAQQDAAFDQVVDWVIPSHSGDYPPLCQALYAWQSPNDAATSAAPVVRKFDLALCLRQAPSGIVGRLAYNTAIFYPATVERMAMHFCRLLTSIVDNPQQPVTTLTLLSAAERQQLLDEWTATARPYPQHSTIAELFAAQVDQTPDAIALVSNDELIAYGALNQRANQLAHYLQTLGIGPDISVGVYLERSPDLIIALLAILKAGGFYVPLATNYPQERMTYVLRDAQVKVVLTQASFVPQLPSVAIPVVCLAQDWPQIAAFPAHNPLPTAVATNLAYVNYTSGSTGRPKGVCISHQAVIRLVKENTFVNITAADVFFQYAPVAFDAATFEIWGSLLNGARLVLCPPQPPTLAELGDLLIRHHVTTLWLTAGLFHLMVEEQAASLGGLSYLLAGGDVLSVAHVQRVLRLHPHLILINGYGPTENTTFTCCNPLNSPDHIGYSVAIGKPIANTQVYVLDPLLQPVPVGVIGELYAGGDGLARGYLDRPELTAAAFIPHPFSALPGARLYRTGDRVRYLPNGDIEFLGRADHQVKVRGFRIELGEIETVLTQHRSVLDCVVIVREDLPGDQRIIAYVRSDPAVAASASDLRAYAQTTLPAYMVPSAFVFLAHLPLTANGKVDRQALPPPEWQPNTTYVAPRTPLETALAAIWAEVLQIDQVSVDANFFDLGGHSLLATRLVSRIHERLGRDLTLGTVFTASTITAMAAVVERSVAHSAATNRILPVGRAQPLPLSPAQERLWFFEQLHPTSAMYLVPLIVRFTSAPDLRFLEQSWQALVQRHESLRTAVVTTPQGPVQIIMPALTVALPIIDLRNLAPAERTLAFQQVVAEQSRQPIRLDQAPLLRVLAVQFAENDLQVLLTQHHIITDGWSVDLLLRDWRALYAALVAGQPDTLPDLPIQYADYAVWQHTWLQSERVAQQLAYWQAQLADAPTLLALPTTFPRPPEQSYRGQRFDFMIDEPVTSRLQALSRTAGVTLYMTLLAAFATLLMRYSRQTDFIVGTVIAGRTQPEIEDVLGFFVNTLPLRADLTGDPSFMNLLERTRVTALGAFAHQDVPFAQIVDALHPDRDLSYHPLFQVMFILQNTASGSSQNGTESWHWSDLDTGTAQFDLTLELAETAQHLRGSLQFNTDLFALDAIQRLADHYARLLENCVADPHQRLSRLTFLGAAEQQQLLVAPNATARDYSQAQWVHQAFEAQARRDPTALALTDESDHLTYAELNRRANQLAHHLLQLGIGSEAAVAVCFARSVEMVVAILGVLKAGAAYIPLDPDYPADRISWILRDARAAAFIAPRTVATTIATGDTTVITLADAALVAQPTVNPALPVLADQLAYIVYTSGSTGQPKGVQVSHGNVRNINQWFLRTFQVTPHDRLSQLFSPGFDPMAIEIWPSLTSGASLHIVAEATRTLPTALRDWLIAQHITISNMPTALAEQALVLDWPDQTPLRFLLTGAEALRNYPPARFPAAFINNYGPAETTVLVTSGQVPPLATILPPSIGRQIANTQIYLLDDQLNPVPAGVPGELYVSGAQVTRGYVGRADLTAERFIPDPFSAIPGTRMYRTGDLCRYRASGEIEFVGRVDQQIKIRGYRIEIGEIEAALRDQPSVQQALVVVHELAPGDKRLVGYVVAHPADAPNGATLRDSLQQRLPSYMVPATIIFLDALPMTTNGKIDYRALPTPTWQAAATFRAPSSPLEKSLATIWAEVLRVERVGVDDNFFDLGGHSLLATQVISRTRDSIAPDVVMRDIFAWPTIAQFAAHLTEQAGSPATSPPLAPILQAQRGTADLAALIDLLDTLSETEIATLLATEED